MEILPHSLLVQVIYLQKIMHSDFPIGKDTEHPHGMSKMGSGTLGLANYVVLQQN